MVHLRQTSERAGGQALLDRIVERMSSAARVPAPPCPPLHKACAHARQPPRRCGLNPPSSLAQPCAQVLDQNVRKPHPKMIDIVMMPLPGTVKRPGAGEEAAGD